MFDISDKFMDFNSYQQKHLQQNHNELPFLLFCTAVCGENLKWIYKHKEKATMNGKVQTILVDF